MATQLTLEGEETDQPRVRPDTLKFCAHCGDYFLRSQWGEHEDHHLEQVENVQTEAMELEEDEDEEPVEEVGEVWDIELHYSVEYRFRVPAVTKHQAEKIAKERTLDARPADSYHVHTDRREVETIMSDDERLPEDWDPYGEERLWEAMDRAREEDDS